MKGKQLVETLKAAQALFTEAGDAAVARELDVLCNALEPGAKLQVKDIVRRVMTERDGRSLAAK